VLKAPELRGGAFETKANFGSAALPFAYVNDSAILFLASGGISQDKLLAQSDRYGQSNEATVSTENDSARGICEWTFVGQFTVHDHRQLRKHPLGAPAVEPNLSAFSRPVHHIT